MAKPDRIRLLTAPHTDTTQALLGVVMAGLQAPQKHLPCRLLYDRRGSELFEQICRLDSYYLTRCEQAIFDASAAQIVQVADMPRDVVEFGCGSARKTRALLEAAGGRRRPMRFTAIDISRDFLIGSAQALLDEFPLMQITCIAAEYNAALTMLPAASGPRLFLFLGSNIGNFDDPDAVAFLTSVRAVMAPTDHLLTGVDLVKDPALLHAAYNDPEGVTAAFNLNILSHLNQAFNANFAPEQFLHEAVWAAEPGRIEISLRSRCDQEVWIGAAGAHVRFASGERLYTESSNKYDGARFAAISRSAGLKPVNQWLDDRGWFAEFLSRPA
ncbi:MAG: L-histidine N(alpha)-methyltransferase [Armatimonadetes bacterium]|nr:L-histidine N(alpha)-methyltransferase [Armatimonadota bacterium]MDE2206751.1 L-histidine N(alpha)-methyltransferase [Armatimonadota bacterium]